jgi:hypothetical protein
VADGYALVTTVMTERGYPTGDDEQAQADLSVEHAQTVTHFRAAKEISRNAASGNAKTEDLRQALIHYRALFTDLLGVPATVAHSAVTTAPSTAVTSSTGAASPTGVNATDSTHPDLKPLPNPDSAADPGAGTLEPPASNESDRASNYGGMP